MMKTTFALNTTITRPLPWPPAAVYSIALSPIPLTGLAFETESPAFIAAAICSGDDEPAAVASAKACPKTNTVAGLLESELPYTQAPGIAAPPDVPRFVTAAPPTIADASLSVTSLQASTLAIVAALLGEGVGLFSDEVEELDDPHAPTSRPAKTTAASTPLFRM